MEIDALPLERGAVVEMREHSSDSASRLRSVRATSAQSLSPRSSSQLLFMDDIEYGLDSPAVVNTARPVNGGDLQLTPSGSLMRRVQSYQVGKQKKTRKKPDGSAEETRALLREESLKFQRAREAAMASESPDTTSMRDTLQERILELMVNLTSGVIAFLLSSTLAVSCASVVVGHGTHLAPFIAHFIDMNFLGTAVLCVVLAWKSRAPWTLGAIDVFVAPVMSTMAKTISEHLHHDMDRVVPTTVVMVALVSSILGVVFLTMGMLRVTSIANYMPYPVIAGFLSGIGAELIRNGVHMAAEEILTMQFFSWEQQLLAWPAIMFAALARLGQHLRVPVAISFPCLLVASLSGFHVIARTILGRKMHDLEAEGWLFPWPADVVQATPMWYPWAKIDLSLVSWHVLVYECFGYLVTLVILGALKYSVSTTSLSTLFGREISPDNEMRVIGLANIVSGLLGCCGGCHYLSAMGIMKQFEAHEKVPALVCALLLLMMWVVGIRALQFVPKFVFGGLILSVGVHFLEAYFVAPFAFLKRFEKGIVILITLSFLVIGMLEAVGLGVIISMIDLIYRIHEVGCVHHETTAQLTRSSVDRTADQVAYLDAHGNSVFVLRLQGYLFFGTSVNILERIETRMRSLELPKLQYVIIDFGLVPNFDATALLNFRKATVFAERLGFEIYFCGLKKPIELELKRNAAAAPATANTNKVHYLSGNVDLALEECENRLLPTELQPHLRGTPDDWKRMSQLTLWEHFIGLQQHKVATGVSIEDEASGRMKKLLPLAAYLDKQIVLKDAVLNTQGVLTDTFFICYGYINIMIKSEFASGAIPGLGRQDSLTAGSSSSDEEGFSTRVRRASRLTSEESQWLAPAIIEDGCDHWTWGNQANWKNFCNHYATCGSGMQSPIDIPTSSLACGSTCVRPDIRYGTTVGVSLFNIEQTLAAVPTAGSYITWEGVQYNLQWIEFRQPSEHSLGGRFSDFEAQFWHQSTDGAWVAIAVLYNIDSNEENLFFSTFWDHLPEHDDCFCGNGRIESGEACDDGVLNSNTIADRCRLNCVLPRCGDGVTDRGEQCDKGALNNDTLASTSTTDSQKSCRTNCRWSSCGDRVLDAGEECDDGNTNNGDGCTSYCTSECGNGRVDGGEQCDSGTTVNNQKLPDGCRPGCIRAYCGDGVRDSGEQCDTGASNSDTVRNACRTDCRNARCGDGVVDNNEQCDPLNNPLCTSNCTTITPTCGNGRIDSGEECDAGTGNSETASARCRTDCTLPFCGDFVRDSGTLSTGVPSPIVYNESCDVGPLGSTTCNPLNCQNNCGNGEINPPEECDLGGGSSEPNHGTKPNQCRKGCLLPRCGDGVIDAGEDCDTGASNGAPSSSCTLLCRWKRCGDGTVDSLVTDRTKESCDDSNVIDGDGCSSVCQLECGDGVVTGQEQCDMGSQNANAANKCKLTCMVPRCGDGYVDADEECDYAAPGQSLLTCRQNCKLPYCGDGIVDSAMGEDCDTGFAENSDIEIGGCSTRCTRNECGYVNPSTTGDLNRAMACSGCFYSYMGSSTRPPCYSDVHWMVAQEVQKISDWQIKQFQYIWGDASRRSQQGTCNLEDKYSMRMCACESSMGSVTTASRFACQAIPRKPALQTTLDLLKTATASVQVHHEAIHQLTALLVREPLILPTYYTTGTAAASIIACETEAFYNRGHTDLAEAVTTLRAVGSFNAEVQDEALSALIFFEHVLQFYESLQVLTAPRSPTASLSNALALMIGTGAASPFLPYDNTQQTANKETVVTPVDSSAPVLIQRSVTGLQARLFRGAVGFNIDPEIHRFSNIPDETIWYVRFVGVEYLKQYGYRNNNGTVSFNLSDEKVILESNILNLWNYQK